MEVAVRPLADGDLDAAAAVHARAFPRQRRSRGWLECARRAFPRVHAFVTDAEGAAGYVLGMQKAGFREEVVLELCCADEALLVARDPLSHLARG